MSIVSMTRAGQLAIASPKSNEAMKLNASRGVKSPTNGRAAVTLPRLRWIIHTIYSVASHNRLTDGLTDGLKLWCSALHTYVCIKWKSLMFHKMESIFA